ncbi:DUF3127 domain-containing protein [Winogradskyella sp.]|nr:DUF3127 domain-containing protein [Winogradskyella sp.]
MEVTGTIKQILDVEQGTSKAGKEWKKINFILETKDGEYTNTIYFDVFGEGKVDKFVKFNKVGDNVTVSFDVSSREYNERWYTQTSAWMVKKNTSESETKLEEAKDDLPF